MESGIITQETKAQTLWCPVSAMRGGAESFKGGQTVVDTQRWHLQNFCSKGLRTWGLLKIMSRMGWQGRQLVLSAFIRAKHVVSSVQ